VNVAFVSLGQRRGWARVRAVVACLTGVAVFALSAAGLVMIVIAALARIWSFFTKRSIVDAPVWSWAPGGAGALGVLAVVISFLGAFWYFWRGASSQVLTEVAAVPMDRTHFVQFANVVEALSIGIGKPMPDIYITDDAVPNTLSLRSNRRRILVVTTGCASVTRDEFEAMAAHELGHLWAQDAHWVTSGMVALARARRFGALIISLGGALFALVAALAYYGDAILWSTGVIALLLLSLGWIAKTVLRRLEFGVRGHADEIADVVAITLAKNPQSLGAVCVRLAANPDRVSPAGWRSELLWFEAVEAVDELPPGDSPEIRQARQLLMSQVNGRSHHELIRRASRAYGEARVPPPAILQQLLPSAPT
jgi:Zn-dependent protease with chaperone function